MSKPRQWLWMELHPGGSQVGFPRAQFWVQTCLIPLLMSWITSILSKCSDNTRSVNLLQGGKALQGNLDRLDWWAKPAVRSSSGPSARSCTWVTTTAWNTTGMVKSVWKTALVDKDHLDNPWYWSPLPQSALGIQSHSAYSCRDTMLNKTQMGKFGDSDQLGYL